MPKKSKKFIDRKNAVTFHLVHRSQQDPLTADESAPQHVLLPAIKESSNKAPKIKEKQIEEQHKYGIFFDDDYNYLQHLRDVNNAMEWVRVDDNDAKTSTEPKLQLPSSVFASNVEEEVGLLNKAAPHSGPRLDLDPDIVAAMDDDFDYENPENELEDDFMELATAECFVYKYDEEELSDVSSEFCNSEERDEVASLDGPQYTFRDEETRSRFTEYSMSSSVIRRNEQLALLDGRFEKMYSGYDDSEIGALDCEEIEGYLPETSQVLMQYAEEFQKQRQKEQLDKDALALHMRLQRECGTSEEEEEREDLVEMEVPEKEKWDCVSILSTYSNKYNHPTLITEPKQPNKIQINKRTGIPMDVINSGKLTAKALSKFDEQNDSCKRKGPESIGAKSVISTLSTLSIRPKDESPEEKKERKKLLKGYRRERRQEKKLNTLAFRDENKRQVKIQINNQNNVQGNRIL